MPTYEYQCTKCEYLFEAFQSMTDKPLTKCPECGKKVERLVSSGSGIIFKGSGFYETDYKKRACPTTSSDKSACASEKKGACKSCPAAE